MGQARAIATGFCAVLMALATPAWAAKVGTNTDMQGVTAVTIEALPEAMRGPWLAYLARSDAARTADQAALSEERAKLTGPIPPALDDHAKDNGMPLTRDAAWYASDEARHVADVIVSFQTPSGGWGKNVNRAGALRQPGQSYVAGEKWDYVGTIDNDATITEMRFLALVAHAVPDKDGDGYRAALIKGVQYLLDAQYPNGGWPQVWPLQGGYHDAVTFNDNAITHVMTMLTDIADDDGLYGFIPAEMRQKAKQAVDGGMGYILKAQIVTHGRRTVWGQQHDPITLRPVPARKFEPALPCTSESASLLNYLMSIDHPSPAVINAINAGVRWLKETAITGQEWTKARELVARAGAGPIWARFVDPETLQPRFGDRDMGIYDSVNDLSDERHHGYAWYGTWPLNTFKTYVKWAKENAPH